MHAFVLSHEESHLAMAEKSRRWTSNRIARNPSIRASVKIFLIRLSVFRLPSFGFLRIGLTEFLVGFVILSFFAAYKA